MLPPFERERERAAGAGSGPQSGAGGDDDMERRGELNRKVWVQRMWVIGGGGGGGVVCCAEGEVSRPPFSLHSSSQDGQEKSES